MKKILMIVVPLLLVGGVVVGAAMMGMIEIPGLSPAKKKKAAVAVYTEAPETKPLAKKDPPKPETPPAEPAPELDMDKGRKKLAKLWNELDAATILAIAADWKEDELAQQIRYLDPAKASELLGAMKPVQASKISKLLQKLHAEVPPAIS